ncbi:MAG: AraC family transcriptional regulator, partial [Pseudoxanthomonas sp.]
LKLIASDVGYASESALSRAFKTQCGLSPRGWKELQQVEGGL